MTDDTMRTQLEALRKDTDDPTLRVGDVVFCRGLYHKVRTITEHAPGTHHHSPIRNEMTAVEVVTDAGSRWHGITR